MNRFLKILYRIGCIQTGQFTLKSGKVSDVYIDIRKIISFPEHLLDISMEISNIAMQLPYDRICGIPYGGIPLATGASILKEIPMIQIRKKAKAHGMKNLIEGTWNHGDRVILVDDVLTTGSSLLEYKKKLEYAGLVINDVIVFVDRSQEELDLGCNIHSLVKIDNLKELKELEQYYE